MTFRIERNNAIQNHKNKIKPKVSNEFQSILQESLRESQRTKEVKISAHAQRRMDERQITLGEKDLNRLNEAFDTLEKKGARDSLMMYKNTAFIASVNNRTIITAMEEADMEIVTNIDSAIFIK